MTAIKAVPTQDFLQKTLGSALNVGVTASATLNNITGIQNLPGVMIVNRVDSSGNPISPSSKREVIGYTATSGSTVTTLSRGLAGTTDQDHAVGEVVEFVPDVIWAQSIYDALTATVVASTGLLDTTKVVDLTTAQTLTNKVITDSTNNVMAKSLKSASTTVDVSAATAPSNGQVLTATSSTTATWQTSTSSSSANLFQNAIVNSSCEVAQRLTAPTISTSYQYGAVDRYAGKATGSTVTAGTIAQTTSATAGSSGYAVKIAGLTTTGSGIGYIRYRMEAKDAIQFKNGITSFACKVYQDTGGAINYTIFISKATASDNFTSTTSIANSGSISVPNTTATTISFANINTGNIGDVSNGIEIEVQAACGAVTTKNFEFTEFIFNQGATANTYSPKPFHEELRACYRYYQKSFEYATAPAQGSTQTGALTVQNSGTNSGVWLAFRGMHMRAVPTFTTYNPVSANANWRDIDATADRAVSVDTVSDNGAYVRSGSFSAGTVRNLIHWSAESEL